MSGGRLVDAFYVGYLAMPRRHRRFLGAAIPLCLALMLGSAAAIALTQPAPGDGVWDLDEAVTLTGEVFSEPYPMLRVVEPVGRAGVYLLVRPGKLGARGVVEPFDGTPVAVRGYLLHRDGRRIIELDEALDGGAGAITALDPGSTARRPEIAWEAERVSLAGEILDAKCYLGAMKPGHGRGHKACAITCVQGGIPPVLVTRDGEGGEASYHLLVDKVGAPLTGAALAAILPVVGEPVTLPGRVGRLGEWHVLAIDPRAVGAAR